MGSIVLTDEISKVLYKLKWFTSKSNMCSWCGIDTHHLCLGCTDGNPSLLCIELSNLSVFSFIIFFSYYLLLLYIYISELSNTDFRSVTFTLSDTDECFTEFHQMLRNELLDEECLEGDKSLVEEASQPQQEQNVAQTEGQLPHGECTVLKKYLLEEAICLYIMTAEWVWCG